MQTICVCIEQILLARPHEKNTHEHTTQSVHNLLGRLGWCDMSRPKESNTPLVLRQSARVAAGTPLAPALTPTAPVLRTVETPLSPPRAMPRVSRAWLQWCPLGPSILRYLVVLSDDTFCLDCQARIQVMPPATPPREHRMVMPLGGGTQVWYRKQRWLMA